MQHMILSTLLAEAATPVKSAKRELAKERQTRRGPIYRIATDLGILDPVARGDIELEVGYKVVRANTPAKKITLSKDAFRRAVNERRAELNIEALTTEWDIDPDHEALLGPPEDEMWKLSRTDPNRFGELVEAAVDAFVDFREEFFETPKAQTYITRPHHRRWIGLLLAAMYRGDRQLILAPPRSGKTDLLIHFATWSCIRSPNIRIMWVGASLQMAEKAVDSIRMQLEENEKLATAYLPPGVSWKPVANRGGGSLWSRNEFTIATRTVVGSKSPTVVAVGSGGKILSRDTDLIVLDDIEDSTTVQQPGRREQTREWLDLTIESRKELETALFMIGSRQHVDDAYGHLIENERWRHVVESAHALDCAVPPEDYEAHTDCVLFPERLDHEALMEKREVMSLRAFELQYLNVASPGESAIFSPEVIEACLNHDRGLGTAGLPVGLQLIAGLDPALGKTQAAVLWGIDAPAHKAYIIDAAYGGDGGVDGAKRLMARWLSQYQCQGWIIEENNMQRALYLSEDVKEWAGSHGITLRGHVTGLNKWDEMMGVGSMRPSFEDLTIDIPYGTPEAVGKMQKLRNQLVAFTDESKSQRKRSVPIDLVMAMWFPWDRIQQAMRNHGAERIRVHHQLKGGWLSYPGLDVGSFGDWNEAPW